MPSRFGWERWLQSRYSCAAGIAAPLYAVSLVAVLVQFGWTFFGSIVIADKGASAAIFPLLIIAIGAFSL